MGYEVTARVASVEPTRHRPLIHPASGFLIFGPRIGPNLGLLQRTLLATLPLQFHEGGMGR